MNKKIINEDIIKMAKLMSYDRGVSLNEQETILGEKLLLEQEEETNYVVGGEGDSVNPYELEQDTGSVADNIALSTVIGAGIGSVVPGPGTVAGAAAGAVWGVGFEIANGIWNWASSAWGSKNISTRLESAIHKDTYEQMEAAIDETSDALGEDISDKFKVISSNTADDYADDLYEAMDGAGTYEDDIRDVMDDLSSMMDLARVADEFGKKEGYTLAYWLDDELSPSYFKTYVSNAMKSKPAVIFDRVQYDTIDEFMIHLGELIDEKQKSEKPTESAKPTEPTEEAVRIERARADKMINALKGGGFTCIEELLKTGKTTLSKMSNGSDVFVFKKDGEKGQYIIYSNGRIKSPDNKMGKINCGTKEDKTLAEQALPSESWKMMDGEERLGKQSNCEGKCKKRPKSNSSIGFTMDDGTMISIGGSGGGMSTAVMSYYFDGNNCQELSHGDAGAPFHSMGECQECCEQSETVEPTEETPTEETPTRTAYTWEDVLNGKALMKVGHRGDVVKHLQSLLNSFGAKLSGDGIYGKLTRKAVIDFQTKVGLKTDGLVGKGTANKLESNDVSSEEEEITVDDNAEDVSIKQEVDVIDTPEEAKEEVIKVKEEIKTLRKQKKDLKKQKRGLKKLKKLCKKHPNIPQCADTEALNEWIINHLPII